LVSAMLWRPGPSSEIRWREGPADPPPSRPSRRRAGPCDRGPMKVLLLSSEVEPFAKTGGLADVAASLPRALRDLGHAVAVMMPAYRRALDAGPTVRETGVVVRAPVGPRAVEGRVLASALPGCDVPVFLIDRPSSFDRRGLYGAEGADYPDNCERFVFFQ